MTLDLDKLEALAKAATPLNYSSAQVKEPVEITCPYCNGVGDVDCLNIFNFDDLPIGVQVFGIGNEVAAAESYIEAFTPATALALIARVRELEEALKPFAEAANNFDQFNIACADEWYAYGGTNSNQSDQSVGAISVAHLRQARTTLERINKQLEG
jgi:hypothetical protein